MNGNDPTMNKIRLNHLIQVAQHFTGEDWKSDQVKNIESFFQHGFETD